MGKWYNPKMTIHAVVPLKTQLEISAEVNAQESARNAEIGLKLVTESLKTFRKTEDPTPYFEEAVKHARAEEEIRRSIS